MTSSDFYKKLLILSGGMSIFLFALSQFPVFEGTFSFSFVSLSIFVLLTMAIFHLGTTTVNNKNKNQFSNIIFLSIFGKLVLTFAILLGYHYLVQPSSKMYVLLFLIIYIVFTIFETALMMRIAKLPEEK